MKTKLTNTEILEKVLNKAIKQGLNKIGITIYIVDRVKVELLTANGTASITILNKNKIVDTTELSIYSLLFSHDFAKAFWGDSPDWDINSGISSDDGHNSEGFDSIIPNWQHCLIQMVLCADPINYLRQFIEE